MTDRLDTPMSHKHAHATWRTHPDSPMACSSSCSQACSFCSRSLRAISRSRLNGTKLGSSNCGDGVSDEGMPSWGTHKPQANQVTVSGGKVEGCGGWRPRRSAAPHQTRPARAAGTAADLPDRALLGQALLLLMQRPLLDDHLLQLVGRVAVEVVSLQDSK